MDRRKVETFVKLGAVGAGSNASPHFRLGGYCRRSICRSSESWSLSDACNAAEVDRSYGLQLSLE